MSSPGDPDIVTTTRFPGHLSAVPAPREQRQARDPSLRMDDQGAKTLPLAGQPGHGRAASLRRQPGRVVDGRMEGAPTSAFELICPSCGDHRYLDYSEVSPRLQGIRGPYPLEAGLTAYEMHLGLSPRLHEVTPGRSGGPKPAAMRASLDETAGGYRHEAFLYSGIAEFLTEATSFTRRAVRAGDPVLVVVTGSKIDALRRELGAESQDVSFADMAKAGGNPGRIITALRDFVQAHAGAPQIWGITEPMHPGRSPAELAECQLHEALLNVTFDASTPFWLLCPYDLEALTASVIDEAHRTHPFVARGEDRQASAAFRPVGLADPFARPLPARPADAAYMAFQAGRLDRLRAFVAQHAWRAGLDEESGTAIVRAVNEIATNSIQHGAGQGELRAWSENHSLVCEVSDHSHVTSLLAGHVPPPPTAAPGTGLWLANQLCDLVQIYSYPGGTDIRLHQNR
jgi:anti-sigma regulatory factor (Ser/Thr protein kinase)